MDISYTAWKE